MLAYTAGDFMRTKQTLAIMLGSSLLLSACGGVTSNDLNAIYSRINNNERQIQSINNQIGSGSGSVPNLADTRAQMQALQQDVNSLKGQMDDVTGGDSTGSMAQMQTKMNQIETALRQMAGQLAIELPSLDSSPLIASNASTTPPAGAAAGKATSAAGAVAAGTTGAVAGTAAATATAATKKPATSQDLANKLYNSGTKAFSEKRYGDAVKIFSDFVNTYPKHKLTSNAYFWQGESYYQQKNYSNAILAYQQIIEKFPSSSKMQSALLKQGVSMYNRGQKDAAQIRLNELIRKFPKSQEADRAKDFLKNNKLS